MSRKSCGIVVNTQSHWITLGTNAEDGHLRLCVEDKVVKMTTDDAKDMARALVRACKMLTPIDCEKERL